MSEYFIRYICYDLKNIKQRTKEKMKKILDSEFKKTITNFFKKPIPAAVLSSVLATLICTIAQSIITIPKAISKTVDDPEYVAKLSESIGNYNNVNNNSDSKSQSSSDNNNYVTVNLISGAQLENYSEELEESLGDVVSVEKKDVSKSRTANSKDEIVATDVNGKEYTADELIGQQVTLKYTDETEHKIVYFTGSYNENYHWDGLCLTNSYNENGTFYGACSSNFDDGVRENYESIIVSAENEWQYADKVCSDAGNDGINITYSGETDVQITYSDEEQITLLSVKKIYDALLPDLQITSYYKGKTVNEKYEDESDQAYLLNFDDCGRILLIYQGPFQKGFPNSNDEYNGWEIAYSNKNHCYYCNEGEFINGRATDYASDSITEDKIKEYIKQKNFDPDINLHWICD